MLRERPMLTVAERSIRGVMPVYRLRYHPILSSRFLPVSRTFGGDLSEASYRSPCRHDVLLKVSLVQNLQRGTDARFIALGFDRSVSTLASTLYSVPNDEKGIVHSGAIARSRECFSTSFRLSHQSG